MSRITGEHVFAYEDDLVALQRLCDAEGCDNGLLHAPARECPACRGTGFQTRWAALAPSMMDATRMNEGDPISGLREKRLEELQELADKIMEQRDA